MVFASATGLMTVGCLANGVNGQYYPTPLAPAADSVICAVFSLVAVVVGLTGNIRNSRTLCIAGAVIFVWITSYSFNVMLQQILVVLDGYVTETTAAVFLTGYELGISIATCVFSGLNLLFTLLGAISLWIYSEILQDLTSSPGLKAMAYAAPYTAPYTAPAAPAAPYTAPYTSPAATFYPYVPSSLSPIPGA